MSKQSVVITSLPRSPEDDQRSRMIKYSIMMLIRIVCLGLCLVVHGWWIVVCILGAVFLPYVAVVLANVSDSTAGEVEHPEFAPLMIAAPESAASDSAAPNGAAPDETSTS